MDKDLEMIKKNYGENFAKLCRTLFPTILEIEGFLPKIIMSTFAPSHYLYEDIISNEMENKFKNLVYSLIDVEQKEVKEGKSVKELLEQAGYDFYECHNEKEIQSFKKYYAKNEELCTFHGGRLNRCHVFWAVKKNVNSIKREDFNNPKREDEYGTSVISIQFTKGNVNTLSIKNRYNHRVNNPDATFSNNLENIIPGLTDAFEREYRLNINATKNIDFELDGYVLANDGKYYKYNYEIDNIYYCPNNIIIADGEVINIDKNRFILMDYFIIDKSAKKIFLCDERMKDSFIDGFKDLDKTQQTENGKIKKASITESLNKQTGEKTIIIKPIDQEEIIIKIDKYNRITEYDNKNLSTIGDNFILYNQQLKSISLPNVEKIGDNFLYGNKGLKNVSLPNVKEIGDNFLYENKGLKNVSLPNVKKIDSGFLWKNKLLENITLPNVEKIGYSFLVSNEELKNIALPNVKEIGNDFLWKNKLLENITLPKVEKIGPCFLYKNKELKNASLPNVKIIGAGFLQANKMLKNLSIPSIKWAYIDERNEHIWQIMTEEIKKKGEKENGETNNKRSR